MPSWMYSQKQNRLFSQDISPITLAKEIRTKDTDIAYQGNINQNRPNLQFAQNVRLNPPLTNIPSIRNANFSGLTLPGRVQAGFGGIGLG
jgi:hypothetical protein